MADFIFAQDQGTGVSQGSETWLDAVNLGLLAYTALGEHIATGLTVTAPGDGTIDVDGGVAHLHDPNASTEDHGSGGETRSQGTMYSVEVDSRSSISLPNSGGMNYVFLSCDPSTLNSVSIDVEQSDTTPPAPSLKIAEVDDGTDTVTAMGKPQIDTGNLIVDSLTGGITGGQDITNLLGTGLSVSSGTLNVALSHGDLALTSPDDHHDEMHGNEQHSTNMVLGDYEIQKDGQDGEGIINFKTQ